MAYLRKGNHVVPGLHAQGARRRHAELTLRGTLVNEAEDYPFDVHSVVPSAFRDTDYLAPVPSPGDSNDRRGHGGAKPCPSITTQIMNRAAIVSNATNANQFGAIPEPVNRPVEAGGELMPLGQSASPRQYAASDYTFTRRKI